MNAPTPAEIIEQHLLTRKGWVSAEDLCRLVGLSERALRGIGTKPGLCSDFAISGDKGYRHISTCTEKEWDRFYARIGEHSIRQLVRRKRLKMTRQALLEKRILEVAV